MPEILPIMLVLCLMPLHAYYAKNYAVLRSPSLPMMLLYMPLPVRIFSQLPLHLFTVHVASLWGLSVSRPAPIMLEVLPIILSRISQKINPLFF